MVEIEINDKSIEPKEYFTVLKGRINKSSKDKLRKQLDVLGEQIIMAKKIGQENFLNKLSFCYKTILKEQELLARGVEDFVYKDDIKSFIDKVEPKNSIKIIELSRYQRAIPIDNLKIIEETKKWNLFDDYCVVFTDFTDNNYQTEEERKLVERNRDPIVFGYFKEKQSGAQHERFYLVADWEDEYCELTFNKMIEKMAEIGIDGEHKIGTDHNYLMEIINEDKEEDKESKSFWSRLWPLRKK